MVAVITVVALVAVVLIATFGLGGSSFGMNARGSRLAVILHPFQRVAGGRCEIRTHGAVADTPDFKSGAFNRSANLPFRGCGLTVPAGKTH